MTKLVRNHLIRRYPPNPRWRVIRSRGRETIGGNAGGALTRWLRPGRWEAKEDEPRRLLPISLAGCGRAARPAADGSALQDYGPVQAGLGTAEPP